MAGHVCACVRTCACPHVPAARLLARVCGPVPSVILHSPASVSREDFPRIQCKSSEPHCQPVPHFLSLPPAQRWRVGRLIHSAFHLGSGEASEESEANTLSARLSFQRVLFAPGEGKTETRGQRSRLCVCPSLVHMGGGQRGGQRQRQGQKPKETSRQTADTYTQGLAFDSQTTDLCQ